MRRMSQELFDLLWEPVLAKTKELMETHEHRSSWRSIAYIGADGHVVTGILQLGHKDGSSSVFHVSARQLSAGKCIEVDVRTWHHNDEQRWEALIAQPDGLVLVDGEAYHIQPERSERAWRGFGGREFQIRFADGEVTTTNLWHCGTVPPVFRDRLPDNAVFVSDGGSVSHRAESETR